MTLVSTKDVYTIGHSIHAIDYFIELLTRHGITEVADVRSSPYSRMNPQYNREPLRNALNETGISYVYLGEELGARSDDLECYLNDKVKYDVLSGTKLFQEGLNRVRQDRQQHRIALMCAEKDPLHCHRAILVARRLVEGGTPVEHILSDRSVETHAHTISRLLDKLNIPKDDLFRSEEEAILEAYRIQGEAIAYGRTGDDAANLS